MFKYGKLYLLAIVMFSFTRLLAQKITFNGIGTFYIVHHAEKDTGRDPQLTARGLIRAGDLYRKLENSSIKTIYTTNYRRTKMTGDSLRIYQQIDTIYYSADTTAQGLAKQLNHHFGKEMSVLIIAHSNTIPAIIRMLGVRDFTLKELPETAFDDLFIVRKKKKKVLLRQQKYGTPNS